MIRSLFLDRRKSILDTALQKGLGTDFVREQGGSLRSGKAHYTDTCIYLLHMRKTKRLVLEAIICLLLCQVPFFGSMRSDQQCRRPMDIPYLKWYLIYHIHVCDIFFLADLSCFYSNLVVQ